MKQLLTIILIFSGLASSPQNIFQIDQQIAHINATNFTDTVVINDTLFDLEGYREKEIIGFMSGDTLLKCVAKFKNSDRVRVCYYAGKAEYENAVIYVKDTDKDNNILCEVYGWNEKPISSVVNKPVNNDEIKSPFLILARANYNTPIGFKIVDRKALKYEFEGKLIENVPFPPPCGNIAFAVVHKFEVITTTHRDYPSKYVRIIEPCPEFKGNEFFKVGRQYKIYASTNSGVTFFWAVVNKYEQDATPIFWSKKTTPE